MQNGLIKAVQEYVDRGVPARSVPIDWGGQRYWIKISLTCQRNIWHKVQDIFAGLTRIELLRSTVSASGQKGLDEEAARLARVAKRDVLVPEVVARQPGWLLLSDIGPCVFDEVRSLGDDEKEALLVRAIEGLAILHQKGGWHGTGQLRDMVLSPDGQIGFIDFEEAVGEVMAQDAAQARDVLRFLVSVVRFDDGSGQLLTRLLDAYRAQAPKTVWPHIRHVMRFIGVLALILNPFRKKLGRDVRESLLVYNALKPIVRQP